MYERIKALFGQTKLEKLQNAKVLVIGLGGVGYTASEVMMRSGISQLTLVDFDLVSKSNINRQLLATHSVIDKPKCEVAKARLIDINPDAKINCYQQMLCPENIDQIFSLNFDYVVDAIDTIAHKVFLMNYCLSHGIKFISSLGAGNRIDPTKVAIGKLSQTSGCPFARTIRRKLRVNGKLPDVTVAFSKEEPVKICQPEDIQNQVSQNHTKSLVGSFAPVTITFGNLIATKVITDLIAD